MSSKLEEQILALQTEQDLTSQHLNDEKGQHHEIQVLTPTPKPSPVAGIEVSFK